MNPLNGDSSDSDSGYLSKLEINEEYARRFEHNKKREDLQRFEELKKKGVISDEDDEEDDSSDEEDEDDIVNYSRKFGSKFFDLLIKIKKRDPSLKDNNVKFWDSDNEVNGEVNERKRKPVYLKDVIARHLVENGAEFVDEDEEINDKSRKKSYVEEQEMTRKEFLDVVEGIGDDEDEDEGEFLKVKEDKNEDGKDEDEIEYRKKVDEYFKNDTEFNENQKNVLFDLFDKSIREEKEKDSREKYDFDMVDGIDISEDEKAMDRQDEYEAEYHFRYEENKDDRVEGHSRKIVDSVRKIDKRRKIQRKNKEERKAQAEFDRKEELKRLKNLKKNEMNEKIRKIRKVAGIGEKDVCVLNERDLDEDFDPEEYDKKMKKAFDDEFYEADDVDPGFGSENEDVDCELKKPNFDEEDELLGLQKSWDGDENCSADGFLATRKRTVKDGEKKKKKRKSSELEDEVIKELDEYYKLDYEDTIGDLKTRFKYKPVNKNTYGLKAKDILTVDDKELNQLIPLKKMATYREDEFIVPRHKIKLQKQKIKSLLKGESSDGYRHVRKKSTHEVGDVETENPKAETENEEQKPLSKKQRRKMRNKEFKLPINRLIAYKKIEAKGIKKKKNKAK